MQAAAQNFTSAQSGAVLVPVDAKARARVYGVIFTADADISVSPLMRVKLGSYTLFEHPGVPAGGGLAVSGFSFTAGQGDDVTFDCDAPTGGSVSVVVAYDIA